MKEDLFLEVNSVCKGFGKGSNRVEVLKKISFSIKKGEFALLLGPSGSGKSTLLHIIGGIDFVDDGYIFVEGQKIKEMSKKALLHYRRSYLGYLFQQYNLIPNLTVKENIEVGAYLSKNPFPVNTILNRLGLYEHRNKLPNQLSGGQQQRTSLGRAIVKNPQLLLCDEPTGALDYHTSKEILKLLQELNQEYSTTIVMVTHNNAIEKMSDHILMMHDGSVGKDYYNSSKIDATLLEW